MLWWKGKHINVNAVMCSGEQTSHKLSISEIFVQLKFIDTCFLLFSGYFCFCFNYCFVRKISISFGVTFMIERSSNWINARIGKTIIRSVIWKLNTVEHHELWLALLFLHLCNTDFIPRWTRFVAHVRPSNKQYLLLLTIYVRMPNALQCHQVHSHRCISTVFAFACFTKLQKKNIFSTQQRTLCKCWRVLVIEDRRMGPIGT